MTLGMAVNFEGHPRSELLHTFQDLIAHMESAGYSVLLSIVRNEGVDLDTLLERFLAHRVDGLFYWNARPSNSLAWYERFDIPVIAVVFRDPDCARLPLVSVDGTPAFTAACKELKALGHRDFAEIVVDRFEPIHKMYPRIRGVRWHEIRVGHRKEELRDAVEQHLHSSNTPTVVFASPPTTTQLLSIADEFGIRIPKDLSVVSLFDLDEAPLFRTPVSGIRTDYDKLGQAVATAMLEALAGRPVNDVMVENSAHYIPRASTGPARTR